MFLLSIAALVFATLFAGAALYISLVEHPARLGLADGPLLARWQPSYKRALPIQSGLAIAGGVAGSIIGYLSTDWHWFAGSALLLANWPFTLRVPRAPGLIDRASVEASAVRRREFARALARAADAAERLVRDQAVAVREGERFLGLLAHALHQARCGSTVSVATASNGLASSNTTEASATGRTCSTDASYRSG